MKRSSGIDESSRLGAAVAGGSSSDRRFEFRRVATHALLLVALTLVAYLPARHAGFIWDDDSHVTANASLRSFDGLRRIWFQRGATPQYYPLVHTGFWIEYHLWRLNPAGYHSVNILLHALNAILVWLVLRRLRVNGAWIAAAIFALHPVHVESVAWVTERKNVLSGFFYLSALATYLRFDPDKFSEVLVANAKQWRFYWLAFALYLCALLSKSVTCTLPVVILLLIWWKHGRLRWRDAAPLVPLFVLGGVMGLNTVWMERHRVGAEGAEYVLSLVQRCLIASRVIWFYVGKLVWPLKLIFIYPRWQIDPTVWWQWLFAVASLAAIVILWACRSRWGRGPLAAVLFFVVTLTPALGFFDVYPFRYSFVADHFQYLASLGIIVLVAAGSERLFRPWAARATVNCVVLTTLGVLSWQRCEAFRDEETSWRDTIAKNPGCWMAHVNLGLLLQGSGGVTEAITHYQEALRAKPDGDGVHNDWGNALLSTGDVAGAIQHFEQALRIKPDSVEAQINWGNALLLSGRSQGAIERYELALHTKPDSAEAHYNLGRALQQTGKLGDAMQEYTRALQSQPDFADAHNNLGDVLRQTGRIQEAIEQFLAALRIKPDDAGAHYNLGLALSQTGKVAEAIGQYEQALRIKPNYAAAHNNLGNVLLAAGKVQEAIQHFEQALRIKPDYAAAQSNLGNALLQAGRIEDAIHQYELALQRNPDSAVGHYNLGNALLRADRRNDAVAQYQEAIRLDPNLAQAREMLARLSAPQ